MNKDKIWHLIARKLTGEASAEELHELGQLLQNHYHMQYDVQVLEQLWMAECEHDEEYLEATYLLHKSKMQKQGVSFASADETNTQTGLRKYIQGTPRKLAILASLALVIVTSIFFFGNSSRKLDGSAVAGKAKVQQPVSGIAETRKANKTKLVLPDGSTVWLNSGSKLSYVDMFKSADKREVTLSGEAYFDVVHNKKKPFIIHTSSIDVKVLGTEFNVKAYPEDATVETSLIRGSVRVVLKNDPSKSYLLKPNQKLVLFKPGEVVNTTNEKLRAKKSFEGIPKVVVEKLNYINGSSTATEAAWVSNLLSFHDESFKEVAVKMERWYDVEFEFKNKRLELEQLTGMLPSESLEKAMAAWKFTTPGFNYRIENDKVIIF